MTASTNDRSACSRSAASLALVVVAALLPFPARAISPAIDDVPLCLANSRADLQAAHDTLVAERTQLEARISQHNARCHDVEENSSEAQACTQGRDQLRGVVNSHVAQTIAFNDSVRRVPNDAIASRHQKPEKYRPTGNGLIGGTSWIVGYNVQTADPKVTARAHEMMAQQMTLAGANYADAVDFQKYNFVLGIAASTNVTADLACRVLFDQLRNGQFTAQQQQSYNLVRGRQFGVLGCHSNGAMICLAALENEDVIADRVELYGPQLTRESLQMWQDLVKRGHVKSVQIFINQGDPVPPFTIALDQALHGKLAELTSPVLTAEGLSKYIHDQAPDVAVRTFGCTAAGTLGCHAMDVYRANISCTGRTRSAKVPGTALHGESLLEPPLPCGGAGR
jgi:hypothetical protein